MDKTKYKILKNTLKNSKVKQLMKRLGIRGNDVDAAVKVIQHFARNPSDLRAMGV